MGLVQHEGGPCGVLAAIQVTILYSFTSQAKLDINYAFHFSRLLSN